MTAPMTPDPDVLHIGDEVRVALAEHRPVVALESTIFSGLGLPSPANATCLDDCLGVVRREGAVPALTAVIDGRAVVGVDAAAHERVLNGTVKVAARDLGVAVASGVDVGVTTVSASVTRAAAAGISVFATGGIGGVHRGAAETGDISHALTALARHPVVTVSAGAKAFLDLPRTVEELETLGVPVLGFGTDVFPAFYTRDSGVALTCRVDSPFDVAVAFAAARRLGHPGGILVANPIPEEAELDGARIDSALDAALREVDAEGLRGPAVTPLVLAALADATDGESIPANLALAANNAAVAARIAAALVESG